MKTYVFNNGRFVLFVYAGNYARYKQVYTPAVIVSFGDKSKYIDVELKILCFGFGIRFFW